LPQTERGFSLNVNGINGYSAGYSDIYITLRSGRYIVGAIDYRGTPTGYALTISGGRTGDTITFTNNGTVAGRGGRGYGASSGAGTAGAPALLVSTGVTVSLRNNGKITGGGSGGGWFMVSYAAGGAAFGSGGWSESITYGPGGGELSRDRRYGENGGLLTGGNGGWNGGPGPPYARMGAGANLGVGGAYGAGVAITGNVR